MKLVVLHPDDYDRALAAGMIPFDIDEDREGDKIRICIDHYLAPEKGEALIFDISPLPPFPRSKLVFHGSEMPGKDRPS